MSPFSRRLLTSVSIALLASSAFAQAQGEHPQNAPHEQPHQNAPHQEQHHEAAHTEATHAEHTENHAPPQVAENHAAPQVFHRDNDVHRRGPEVIVHTGDPHPPRYISRSPIYYHYRGPRYYTSFYYTNRYIPIETASPYVEVRCTAAPITGTIVGGSNGLTDQFGQRYVSSGAVLLGPIIGHGVGSVDESCAYQALEYAQPGMQVAWADPQDLYYSYSVTPGPVSRDGYGRFCRSYHASVLIGNQMQDGEGTACRAPNGTWQLVN